MEIVKSPLMGIMEKKRCTSFFIFIARWVLVVVLSEQPYRTPFRWVDEDLSTHDGIDGNRHTMMQVRHIVKKHIGPLLHLVGL